MTSEHADLIRRLRQHDGHLGHLVEEAADEIERLRAALDKIIGVSLGKADFPAAKVHKIAHDALGSADA